jgi:integrase
MLRRLPDIPLSDVSADVIQQYRDERLAAVKPNSVLRELGALSAVFEHAHKEWRLIESNPVRAIRKPARGAHRKVTFSREQIRRLLSSMGYAPRQRVATVAGAMAVCFLVALRTGMRAGELCGLTWERVTSNACQVSGTTPAASRDVPMTEKTRRLIEKMRGFDPVFVFGLKSASLDAMFRKYRGRAGLHDLHFHDARHTAATWLVRDSQLNAFELCRVMGWTDPKMALVYFQPSVDDLVKRMAGRK